MPQQSKPKNFHSQFNFNRISSVNQHLTLDRQVTKVAKLKKRKNQSYELYVSFLWMLLISLCCAKTFEHYAVPKHTKHFENKDTVRSSAILRKLSLYSGFVHHVHDEHQFLFSFQ